LMEMDNPGGGNESGFETTVWLDWVTKSIDSLHTYI
jgi:hypothetical protein